MKRRDFLKVAGKSIAGFAIAPTLLDSCEGNGGNGGTPDTPEGPAVEKPTGHFSLWQLTSASDTIGNSYVLKTREGNLIVMDGGMETNGDAEKLRGYIKSKGGNKVKAWWLSHPHGDHIGAFLAITNDLQGMAIDTVYYSRLSDAAKAKEGGGALAQRLYDRLDVLAAAGVKVVNLNLGSRYDMDGIFIKVLGIANPEFLTASQGTSVYNEQSVIVRFEDDTKSVVFTGDASEQAGDKAIQKYFKYLNCDYIQMAHHGQKGVRESFYKNIEFKHCLWPTPKWLWQAGEAGTAYADNPHGYNTHLTRAWMAAKGIPEANHHVAWRDVDWYLA